MNIEAKSNSSQSVAWLTELSNAVRPKISSVEPPIKFLYARVYNAKIVVVNYLVHGREIAFDITPDAKGKVRVEVFDRKKKTPGALSALGYPVLRGARLLAAEFPALKQAGKMADSVAQVILETVDRISSFGPSSEDAHLIECLQLNSPVIVVDVGANPLSAPPYTTLRLLGLCHVIGFEPQPDAYEKLRLNKAKDESYFPYAIGAPGEVELNVYRGSGFTSTFRIDERAINFIGNGSWINSTRLQQSITMECKALDDVPNLPEFDLLKIDIQGGELNAFKHARSSLASALCVIPEVSFYPLYENAPSFADVHQELEGQGFLLHKFIFQKQMAISNPYVGRTTMATQRSQLLDGDAVYLKDLRDLGKISTRQLKVLALLGHFVFFSSDLVMRVLGELEHRSDVSAEAVQAFIDSAAAE